MFYLLLIIAQENVASYYALFALAGGFAAGLYWIGYLVLMYDVSTDSNRIRYLGLNMVFFNAACLLAGTIIGRSENLQGYIITFTLSFIMFLLAAVVSLRVRTTTMRHKSYYLKLMPLLMRKNTV